MTVSSPRTRAAQTAELSGAVAKQRVWKQLEARVCRWFGPSTSQPARWLLSLFFVGIGAACCFSSRASWQHTPLDFIAQALSILTVGRITFVASPHWLGGIELGCGFALLAWPRSRGTGLLLFSRFILGFLTLFMLRDDLWRSFPTSLSAAGLGVVWALFPVAWAFSLAMQSRWSALAGDAETAALLYDSPSQQRARRLAWRRAAAVGVPLLLSGFIGVRSAWPHYIRWFHARQEAAALDEHLAGKLIKKSMPPSVLLGGRKITTWVYLPPGYERCTTHYPVIYVMHGMPGEVRDCFVKGRVQDTAEKLIQTRQIHPVIIVGWDAEGPGGPTDVTNFLDRPGYPMESFITQELVPYIDRTYRTIPQAGSRALDGISAGGYGAANLLFKYPQLWRIGSSHNGFFAPADDAENMRDILGPPSKRWQENDPMKQVLQHSGAEGLHFYGDIGDGDDLQSEFVAFGNRLQARGIQNEMKIFPGRHTWAFWSDHFANSFRFADKWFRSPDSKSEKVFKSL